MGTPSRAILRDQISISHCRFCAVAPTPANHSDGLSTVTSLSTSAGALPRWKPQKGGGAVFPVATSYPHRT
jgi:hypothetical protein